MKLHLFTGQFQFNSSVLTQVLVDLKTDRAIF